MNDGFLSSARSWWETSAWPFLSGLNKGEQVALIFIAYALLYLVFRLARSVDVTENGKVVVTYHSPITWPARFQKQVTDNRSSYSPDQKKLLSSLRRGRDILEGLLFLIFGLLLLAMAAVLIYDEPSAIFELMPAGFLIGGVLAVLYAVRRFLKLF